MKILKLKPLNLFFFSLLLLLGLMIHPSMVKAEEASVSSWAQFRTAFENPDVSKITLTQDISYTGGAITLTYRTTDLEIDGTKPGASPQDFNNYKLDLGYTSLMIGKPTLASTATMTVRNITLANYGDTGTGNRGGFIETYGAYDVANAYQYGQYWTFNLENVYVPDISSTTGTARLIRSPRAQINVSGINKLYTRAENFYTGGMDFAPNTQYYGEITQQNYSVIWFKNMVGTNDTGSGDFIVGQNASVKLRNVRNISNTGYPAVYLYYRNIEIGEGAQFTASVPGAAVQFSGNGQTFTAKKDAVVTLTSLNNFPSIQDSVTNNISTAGHATDPLLNWTAAYAQNATMSFEKDSSLFVIGKTNYTTYSMIKLGSSNNALQTNNRIVIDTPKQFDIRNNAVNTSYDAIQVGQYGDNSINIKSSNLAFWKTRSAFSSGADYSYSDIDTVTLSTNNVWTSSDSTLATTMNNLKSGYQTNISRINGLNTIPTVLWQYNITDADKSIQKFARISLGQVPDDTGLDADGNLHYLEQYANADLPVSISNSKDSTTLNLKTDKDGYVSSTLDEYYSSGTVLTAIATRGKLISEPTDSDPVFDITPPTPAQVSVGKVYNTDTALHGENAEVGATLSVSINGVVQNDTVTVGNDGSFTYPLATTLSVGDQVTIYLQDHAGIAPQVLQHLPAPTTNTAVGNINPATALSYSDATFPAATSYIVEQGKAVLTIQFEDEAGNVMTGYTMTAGEAATNTISTPIFVGDVLDLTKAPFEKIQEQIDTLETAGYEVVNRPSDEQSFTVSETAPVITYKIKGLLFLKSAPSTVDFGSITFNATTQRIDNPTPNQNLVVTDTRADKTNGWTLYASLTSEMKNTSTGSIMNEALRYVKNDGNELTLNSGNQVVYATTDGGSYDVTGDWGTTATDPGLKLVADPNKTSVSSKGSYSGVITWTIMAGQP